MHEAQFRQRAGPGYNRVPVVHETLADLGTPRSVFLTLGHTRAIRDPGRRAHRTRHRERGPVSRPGCVARTGDGGIMGLRHRSLVVEGMQFHPDSTLTEHGHALPAHFLR